MGSLSCEFTMYYATTDDYGPLLEDVSFVDWTATYDGETLSSTVSGTTQWYQGPSFRPATWTTTFAASR